MSFAFFCLLFPCVSDIFYFNLFFLCSYKLHLFYRHQHHRSRFDSIIGCIWVSVVFFLSCHSSVWVWLCACVSMWQSACIGMVFPVWALWRFHSTDLRSGQFGTWDEEENIRTGSATTVVFFIDRRFFCLFFFYWHRYLQFYIYVDIFSILFIYHFVFVHRDFSDWGRNSSAECVSPSVLSLILITHI